MSARRKRRTNSSLLPENIPPVITSSRPVRPSWVLAEVMGGKWYRACRWLSSRLDLLVSSPHGGNRNASSPTSRRWDTFPTVRDVTAHAVQQVQALYNRVQSPAELEQRGKELEGAANSVIESWVADMTHLGCEVKGLWLVDWDCGGRLLLLALPGGVPGVLSRLRRRIPGPHAHRLSRRWRNSDKPASVPMASEGLQDSRYTLAKPPFG